jgi:hypothetical protein
MKMSDMAPPAALPTYPFGAKAGKLCPEQVAIVDIGGGHGQFLERLRRQSPELPGRFVLQDLQQSIDILRGTKKDLCFEPMAHDMFTPQPIIGTLIPSVPQSVISAVVRKHSLTLNLQVPAGTISAASSTTGPTPTAGVSSHKRKQPFGKASRRSSSKKTSSRTKAARSVERWVTSP